MFVLILNKKSCNCIPYRFHTIDGNHKDHSKKPFLLLQITAFLVQFHLRSSTSSFIVEANGYSTISEGYVPQYNGLYFGTTYSKCHYKMEGLSAWPSAAQS